MSENLNTEQKFKINSFVPAETNYKELTPKSILFGLALAVILGAANAYVGLKAGMTVSATFPAAVMAIAALRPFKGSVLEENITRTTAAVGEALVAGAIFTLPAFFMAGVWTNLRYWPSTLMMFLGGTIGVLFVILLRRALTEDVSLPFPESVACSEIVKAGQKGQSGAKYVFGAMGFAAILEFFKNPNGIQIMGDSSSWFYPFKAAFIKLLDEGKQVGDVLRHKGGLILQTPLVSPALMGVGFIIGPKLATINFSGGVLCWFILVPLALFYNVGIDNMAEAQNLDYLTLGYAVWTSTIRPLAVGTMLVGAFYTLYKMRNSLGSGLKRAWNDMKKVTSGEKTKNRLEKDLPFKWILIGIAAIIIPMFFLYNHFTRSLTGSIAATIIMILTGFLFAAVGGYLVGLIGGSNQPVSGLALSTLLIASLIMVAIGLKGNAGVAAVLATAAVICCSSSMAGDMIQDLKVGQIIGGTPWKMELVVLLSVMTVSFLMYFPISWLHQSTPGGLGGENLPAPQAGLMAMMSQGIVGGQMAWSLVFIGIALGIALIMIDAPSPMLIAVGMYLPFDTTFAIFMGGIFKYIFDKIIKAKKFSDSDTIKAENTGTLIASGMVAGEAIIGVLLAALFVFKEHFPILGNILKPVSENLYIGLLFIPIIGLILIYFPIRSVLKGEGPSYSVKIEQ